MNIIMQDHLPIGFRAVIVDISDRKTREKHMEKLASMIESTPFAILEADGSGNLTYLNKRALQIKPLLIEYQPTIKQHIQAVFETKTKASQVLHLNNQEYHCYYNFNPDTARVNIYIID